MSRHVMSIGMRYICENLRKKEAREEVSTHLSESHRVGQCYCHDSVHNLERVGVSGSEWEVLRGSGDCLEEIR